MIEAVGLTKAYNSYKATDDLHLTVPQNTIYGLLGPNGAGKTSLIRMLTQILQPDSGQILYKGEKLNSKHILHFGYLPEERGLYKKMKVEEQLVYLTQLKGLSIHDSRTQVKHWLQRLDLYHWKHRLVEELSKGMQQKVQFIASVVHQPEVLILDEPFSGFDPLNSQIITEEIMSLKAQGCTILFSTHRMETVESLCDHFALIHKGKNILHGETKTIKENFKQNLYRIEGTGSLPDQPSNFTVRSFVENPEKKVIMADLQALNSCTSNELLSELMAVMQVKSFQEVLPSINEIFIAEVSKHNL